jgi:cation diffusion facilitator family transporter
VLVGLIFASLGYHKADAFAAIGVAIIVLYISYKLGKRAIDVLLDKVPDGITEKVEERLKMNPNIKCYHDLKIRAAGADTFIKVNVHFNSKLDLQATHNLCDEIEKEICQLIPRCEIVVHPEPE